MGILYQVRHKLRFIINEIWQYEKSYVKCHDGKIWFSDFC